MSRQHAHYTTFNASLDQLVPIYLADAQHSVQLLLAMSLYPVIAYGVYSVRVTSTLNNC